MQRNYKHESLIIKDKPQEGVVGRKNVISFSFTFLHAHSYPKCKNVKFFIHYLERLKMLSGKTWTELSTAPRHSIGWEKISIGSIKPDIHLTGEVGFLMAFRATGDNHAFLGFRDGDVFEVVFIETEFGDIYNH